MSLPLSRSARLCLVLFPKDYCYHNGMHFLNAHASFDLWVENNLQKIDPKVSLALWDFMLDAANLGTDWGSSEVFGPDMYGSALGSLETQHQISDGWFAGIQSIYDKDETLLSDDVAISTNHNPFGLVDSSANYQVRRFFVFSPAVWGWYRLSWEQHLVQQLVGVLIRYVSFAWGSAWVETLVRHDFDRHCCVWNVLHISIVAFVRLTPSRRLTRHRCCMPSSLAGVAGCDTHELVLRIGERFGVHQVRGLRGLL